MKLDKGAIFNVAQRLKESKAILARAHQRISQSVEGLISLQDTVAKASRILREPNVRDADLQPSHRHRSGSPV